MTRLHRAGVGFVLTLAALFVFVLPALAAPNFPALTGRVVDDAQMLSPAAEEKLTTELADLEAKTGRQLVVVTLPSLQGYEIADYGYQLGRAWGIGQAKENNGALFIVAPNERKVRIEVGYGLEGVLTDALSSVILQERVLPKFRAGDMEGGVVDGTEAVIQQLALPDDQAKQKVAEAGQAAKDNGRHGFPVALLVFIVFWIIVASSRSRYRNRSGVPWWIWPIVFSGRGGGGGGGGDGGGWGGGDGGFSGGGGGFGGGGASGSW